jgi:uncharacterized membrane protein YbhN (UPF0104 family)
VRWIVHGVLFVALVAGVFALLPRLGGLRHDATGLRHARPASLAAAIAAQALSLGCYGQLYRRVLAALGARVRFRLAADVTVATFFVSHLTPFGSATGTLVNASTLETEGIAATTTGEAIALTSLTSTIALIVLFGTGLAATAGRHVSHGRAGRARLPDREHWLPLVPGAIAYIRLRLRPGADGKRKGKGKPAMPQAD